MSKKIILTGGGTAGHVTPNLALLPRLRAEGYEIHYIGTADGIEKSLVGDLEGVTYHTISAGKLRRYFSLKNLTDPFKVVGGIFQAKRIINKVKPDVVFSKGGLRIGARSHSGKGHGAHSSPRERLYSRPGQ